MRNGPVRWGAIVGGALTGEILMIIAAVAWVAFYSYVINPGQTADAYRAYADRVAAWVSIVTGIPVFYAIGRWWARSASTALAMFAVYFAIDAALIVIAITAADPGQELSLWTFGMIAATSYVTKFAASQFGARRPVAARRLAA